MRRRTAILVATLTVIVVAGCAANGPSTAELPAKPADLSEQNVEEYVEDREEALQRNELVDQHSDLDSVSVDVVSPRVYENSSGEYSVYTRVEYHTRIDNDAGDGWHEVAYFVNETAVLRDERRPGADSTLDPRNGTAVSTG